MTGKSIDNKFIQALCIMSEDIPEGVNYKKFVPGLTDAALDLIEKGYAFKIPVGEDDSNYCLTYEGIKLFERILKYAGLVM
ncbi:MAG: hypothetical protein Q8Q04_02170 [archaeon]|nr:hypothetical protein [archaeon]